MSNNLIDELLYEFRGEKESFLITIRCDLEWSHDKFIKFLSTIRNYCKHRQLSNQLDKEIAQGFWFISWFIKDWTSHPDFRKANKFSDNYYTESYELIHDLSWWYFMEEPIYIEDKDFKEKIKILKSNIKND